MGLWDFLFGDSSRYIITKNGRKYKSIPEENIPSWVRKKFAKMEKRGAISGSFKGKKYRYIIQYVGRNTYECYRRKRDGK